MRKLLIGNEWYFPEDDEAVVDLVEQHMGYDTADTLREIILEHGCGGECDETYKIGDHFRRVIRDAIEELSGIEVHRKCEARLARVVQSLESEL